MTIDRLDPVEWTGGGAAPYQAEGVLSDGRPFYFRARHNTIRLEVPGRCVGFRLAWPVGDDHVWSSLDDDDAGHLIAFLAHTLAHIEWWERCPASSLASPHTVEWTGGPFVPDNREGPKHSPSEVCDCPNPRPGRPHHCAAEWEVNPQ